MSEHASRPATAQSVSMIVYTAAVTTVAMVLFPPYTSFYGTEYALVLSGPEWARWTAATLHDLDLTVRIHWSLLAVQLAMVWALALGAKWILASREPYSPHSTFKRRAGSG